jgi:hypothetical protein
MGLQLSGSVQLEGNLLVTGSANSVFENISVTNRITANEINVQFVSSSIIYSSGSNRFGDEITDNHQFTGSVDVSGSLAVVGAGTFSGTGYFGGATVSSGLTGASELIVQNELGIQNGDTTGPYLRMVMGGVNQNITLVAGAFTGTEPNLLFNNGGDTRLTITPSGSVGVGTNVPDAALTVKSAIVGGYGTGTPDFAINGNVGGNATALQIYRTAATAGDIVIDSFRAGVGAANLIINAPNGGNVGIGIAPTQKFEVNAGQGARAGMALTGEYPYLRFNVTASSANSRNWAFSATNLEAGDFALLQSNAKDGDPVTAGTRILDFTRSGNTIVSGSLTVGKGITVSSEAFGSFFGKFGAASTALLELREFTGDQTGTTLILRSSRPDSGNLYAHIQAFSDSTTQVFRVLANGVVDNLTGAYGSLSDIKLKENIVDATPKLEDLLKVKIRNYNLIGDETKQIGVIAQELEETFPGLVSEYEDFEEVEITDEEGNVTKEKQPTGTTTKSVKYSIFVPMLIKAIQEQQSQIEELKTKVEQLQNN